MPYDLFTLRISSYRESANSSSNDVCSKENRSSATSLEMWKSDTNLAISSEIDNV